MEPMSTSRPRIILVYPPQGFSGVYVRHAPLSLLYAAAEVVKAGYDVRILDTRLVEDYRRALAELMRGAPTLCVGISVMSGTPIRHAREISRAVKALAPGVPVVWGGPHATFHPNSILEGEPACDCVVSGYASETFALLVRRLEEGRTPEDIPGISWRADGEIRSTAAVTTTFEMIDWRDIPYHLIEDYTPYGQLEQDRRIFSMYSALGCPYHCSFCSSPAQYSEISGKKWVPLKAEDVADHIQFLVERYQASYIYFIDDDSFPSLKHVEGIIDEITRRKLPVKLGFRGARINEIKRMSDAFLDKLVRAGTDILHIGAECGSNRLLGLLKKDCTVEDIRECNRKLARHPQITAAYNFIMGIPTETLDELKMTRDLMLGLVEDHPNCIIFPPNKFRPLPGTELYAIAKTEWGYQMPGTLDAWENIEVEGDISHEWYGEEFRRFCNLLLIGSYFIDNKAARVATGKSLFYRLMRLINRLYRPLVRWRLRHGIAGWLVEYHAYRVFIGLISRSA
jgi:anaerobic magnesium-protoporphyrin IX monomethyl ester cyclase